MWLCLPRSSSHLCLVMFFCYFVTCMLRGMESKFATVCHSHSQPPNPFLKKKSHHIIIKKKNTEEEQAQRLHNANLHFKDGVDSTLCHGLRSASVTCFSLKNMPLGCAGVCRDTRVSLMDALID